MIGMEETARLVRSKIVEGDDVNFVFDSRDAAAEVFALMVYMLGPDRVVRSACTMIFGTQRVSFSGTLGAPRRNVHLDISRCRI